MADRKHTKEIALPLPPDKNGNPMLLRVRGDDKGPMEASVGVLMPVEHGKALPLGADLVEVRGRKGQRHLEVETIYDGSAALGLKRGGGWKPLGVSAEKFEANWDRIFGAKPDRSEMN